jgi:hypothetical protein
MKKMPAPLAIFCALIFFSCNKIDPWFFKDQPPKKIPAAAVSTDWYKLQLRILLERNSALNGVYFGYVGLGLYEAVRFADPHAAGFSSALYQMPSMPETEKNKEYDAEVSANAVMAALVKYYYGGLTAANLFSIDSLEKLYNEKRAPHITGAVMSRSQEFGKKIAKAVYDWSLTDKFNPANTGYVPPVFPGAWVPTLPALANGVQPYLKDARPFLAAHLSTAAPNFPYVFSELSTSDFYKMVKKVYTVSKSLTTEQKNIALFWVDQGNGTGYTPTGHDMSIITQAIEKTGVDLVKAAEAYAKSGIAERDATLVCFKIKYQVNLIRPISYIRKLIDAEWMPFIPTPPHPEYPAAHAFVTGSALQAASHVLGNKLKFTDHSYDFRGWVPRTYNSLFAAAEEAGISRLYGGIHYTNSIEIGLMLAEELGDRVGKIRLKNTH